MAAGGDRDGVDGAAGPLPVGDPASHVPLLFEVNASETNVEQSPNSGAIDAPQFDKRPGVLEATRGLDFARLAVMGVRLADGWRVGVYCEGEQVAALGSEHARLLAVELVAMADIVDGNAW